VFNLGIFGGCIQRIRARPPKTKVLSTYSAVPTVGEGGGDPPYKKRPLKNNGRKGKKIKGLTS